MRREFIALLFAMTLPSAMAYGYFVALSSADHNQPGSGVAIGYAIAKCVQLALPIVFASLFGPLRNVHESRDRVPGLRFGLIFGLIVGLAIIVLYQLLADNVLVGVPERLRWKVNEFHCETPMRFVLLAAFLSLMHSLIEEYYWRWFVFRRLRQMLSLWPAAIVSGFAFSGHHLFVLGEYFPGQFWTAAVPFTIGIALGGAFWAWLYEKCGSILAPWLSHVIVDAAIMAIGYKMLFLSA